MSRGPRFLLLGASLATPNHGVSALAASLVKLILLSFPEARITLLIGSATDRPQSLRIGDRQVSLEVANFRLSPRARAGEHLFWLLLLAAVYRLTPLPAWRRRLALGNPRLEAVLGSDFIGDIWAGDSFSDIYGLGKLIIGALPKLLIRLLGRRVVYLPQTYGPFRSPLGRWIAARALRGAKRIMARDRLSLPLVEGLCGRRFDPRRLDFCPDVAFIMDSSPAALRELERKLADGAPRLIGLNVSGLLYFHGGPAGRRFSLGLDYRRFIQELAGRLLAAGEVELLLVPHTYTLDPGDRGENDYLAAREVMRRLSPGGRGRVHLLDRLCDQYELKGLIGACELFVGSRLHACIAALSQGIPTIGVAYSDKFLGVFEAVGLAPFALDARRLDGPQAVARILQAYGQRAALGRELRSRMSVVQGEIQRCFARLLQGGPGEWAN